MSKDNAGLNVRFTAVLFDVVSLSILLCPLLPVCGWGIVPLLLICCTAYLTSMDAFSDHCSLGKRLMGIRVVDGEGKAIAPELSLIRAGIGIAGLCLLFFLDILGLLIWLMGLVYAKKHEGNLPHDVWTGTRTIVVRKPFLHPLIAQLLLTFVIMGILGYIVFVAIKMHWISGDFYERYLAPGTASGRTIFRY